jgi:hypothetical protein
MANKPLKESDESQKSEVQSTSADASTSPTAAGDAALTRGRSTPPTDTP